MRRAVRNFIKGVTPVWACVGVMTTITTGVTEALSGAGIKGWGGTVGQAIWVWIGIGVICSVYKLICAWLGRQVVAQAEIRAVPGSSISIEVGDILKQGERRKITIIAGINKGLKCTLTEEVEGVGGIAPGSLQGQITERWYRGSGNLEAQLVRGMEQAGVTGKDTELGTTIKTQAPGGHRTLWVVMTTWNTETERYDTDVPRLEQSMHGLWGGIRKYHNLNEGILCPVIGAKFGKIPEEPSVLLKRHIRSYVEATKEEQVCERITFMIHPSDYRTMNAEGIRKFLEAECHREMLPEPKEGNEECDGAGTPVGTPVNYPT